MFEGQCIRVSALPGGVAELCFDSQQGPINKFDRQTLTELKEATSKIAGWAELKGVIVTSAKDAFIVGADITEFGELFARSEEEIVEWTVGSNQIFNAFEDLPVPSVAAVNGYALGGGFEMALSADYRVASADAKVGFPEVKLGIIPGFGGTVRAARLIGADNAIEWIASGKEAKADAALKNHAVDAVVDGAKLRDAALQLLGLAMSGKFDWQARRAQKKGKLMLSPIEASMVFETSKAFVAGQAGNHMPAPVAAVTAIQKAATRGRDEALLVEAQTFAKLAKTTTANALVTVFLNDQFVKKQGKRYAKAAHDINQAAVLGAGIMGGGISYQSAVRGTPVIMKDIADPALDLGMNEASKLLAKEVDRGKLTAAKAGTTLSRIRPTLNYGDFGGVDIVVEAVVENPKIKKSVLAEVEGLIKEDAILASNTSSISIDDLATALKRPESFLGMHFFNPVHRMPLVEVIRGAKTSDAAVGTVVGYALKMGKTPIVVKDCPGFLVNRILFPYFFGFEMLVRDGVDFVAIDKAMESFGWPMGPAYLLDVVGIDTSHHVGEVLAAGYPDRMGKTSRSAIDVMYEAKRYGQKNGVGFYRYETDPKGKPKKITDPESYALLKEIQTGALEASADEIVDRMMIPLVIEAARCLEEGIVGSPPELDMGLLMGLGFPPHFGGALKYADLVGLETLVAKCEGYAKMGKAYEPTAQMREMAAAGKRYYGS